jgi:hypothetical protein
MQDIVDKMVQGVHWRDRYCFIVDCEQGLQLLEMYAEYFGQIVIHAGVVDCCDHLSLIFLSDLLVLHCKVHNQDWCCL